MKKFIPDEYIVIACRGNEPRGGAKTEELCSLFEDAFRKSLEYRRKLRKGFSIYGFRKTNQEVLSLALRDLRQAIESMKTRARIRDTM